MVALCVVMKVLKNIKIQCRCSSAGIFAKTNLLLMSSVKRLCRGKILTFFGKSSSNVECRIQVRQIRLMKYLLR